MVAGELPGDPEISGMTSDSRAVQPGFLFAVLKGVREDGAAFIEDASVSYTHLTQPTRDLE